MLRTIFFVVIACSTASSVNGMDCKLRGSTNVISESLRLDQCPNFMEPNLEYCCYDIYQTPARSYCCNAEQFAIKTGLGILVPAVIAVVVIVSLIIFCISCLCCTCCPWYRSRHRGAVYGKVQGPSVVIQHPSRNVQDMRGHQQANPNAYAYPASQAMPNYGQAPPPQYTTTEAYGKQSPYNPTYGQ